MSNVIPIDQKGTDMVLLLNATPLCYCKKCGGYAGTLPPPWPENHMCACSDDDRQLVNFLSDEAREKIREGWIRGSTPAKAGMYWVNLEREPGRVRLFYFSKKYGWETNHKDEAGNDPLVNDQSPYITVYGGVRWFRKADIPSIGYA